MPEGELYTRQQQIGLTTPRNVTVVGVGGIGSWVAILSAMSGVEGLYLFDPDVMEESNRNRLPFCTGSLNRPKVEVVKDYIDAIRPDSIVVGIPEKCEGILLELQLSISNYLIDCTDSPRSQFAIYNKCKEHGGGVRYIRAGYDGTNITVTGAVSGWIRTDVEEEQYAFQPSWVVPAVTVAALAVGKMMKYHDQEVSLDISEIGIPVVQRQRRITARCRQPSGRTPPQPARGRTAPRRTVPQGLTVEHPGEIPGVFETPPDIAPPTGWGGTTAANADAGTPLTLDGLQAAVDLVRETERPRRRR